MTSLSAIPAPGLPIIEVSPFPFLSIFLSLSALSLSLSLAFFLSPYLRRW